MQARPSCFSYVYKPLQATCVETVALQTRLAASSLVCSGEISILKLHKHAVFLHAAVLPTAAFECPYCCMSVALTDLQCFGFAAMQSTPCCRSLLT